MTKAGWIDIAAAADRHHCSTQTIRRRIKQGALAARKEGSTGRDGRWVLKIWVQVSDLDDVFGSAAHDEHVRKIRATAQPFTVEQKVALRKVFLAHLLEREAKRERGRVGGTTAK